MRNWKFCAVVVAILALLFSVAAYAHPGKTDGNKGHIDHSTGEYHYHHGYDAHQHLDMDDDGDLDCPYEFNDKTGANTDGISSGESHSGDSPSSGKTQANSSVSAGGKGSGSGNSNTGAIIACCIYVALLVLVVWDSTGTGGRNTKLSRNIRRRTHIPKQSKPLGKRNHYVMLKNEVILDSSFIAAAAYDNRNLHLRFTDDRVYIYQNVPRLVYEGLLKAQSKGSYFHKNINNIYPYYEQKIS